MTIVVLGSLNQDLVISASRVPNAGETLLATSHEYGFGGKGANQAVAAARLGGRVDFIGCVGMDQQGTDYLALLQREGIGTDHVGSSPTAPTGQAVVMLENGGQNRILVSPGSNSEVRTQEVDNARDLIEAARAVLAQLEVPVQSVEHAFKLGRGTRILNAAPAQNVPQSLLDVTDVLVVNESELASITGAPEPKNSDQAIAGAKQIRGPQAVVVTLGERGAVGCLATGETWYQPSLKVEAIDTTAAGDAFCGALAVALTNGDSLRDALTQATEVSALVVTKAGALSSLPYRQELQDTYGGWTK